MFNKLDKPFALIKAKSRRDILYISGNVSKVNSLEDINWEDESFFIAPFSQIKEKNYDFAGEELPIMLFSNLIKKSYSYDEMISLLPEEDIFLSKEIEYNYSDDEYKQLLSDIIKNEIGNGEGCNFVVPRKASAKISDMSLNKALSIYKRMLVAEYGIHWTFFIYDGEQYFLGASPEGHIIVDNNKVRMHPISGTYRKTENDSLYKFKKDFLNFLSDEKEINELFMVVDEELKMMARICEQGGIIVGPIIKEMSALIHTEYLLTGRSIKSLKEIFRESMYAATIVGGPMESACRINAKYEPQGREYYGAAAVIVGKNEDGHYMDSAILIRTLNIKKDGEISARVGATLVRNSKVEDELEEVKSKLKAALNAVTSSGKTLKEKILPYFDEDSDILEKLYDRNKNLSKFWFFRQEKTETLVNEFINKSITIIDNEDDFCYMLKHILASMGMRVKISRFSDFDIHKDKSDIVILGAGTGNPNKLDDPKMAANMEILRVLFNENRKFMCICLGHQLLCRYLGLKVAHKKELWQGVAKNIDFFGKNEIVGFYNTFTGIYETETSSPDYEYSYDENNQIHAIRGRKFAGIQFHPESILTQNGYHILKREIKRILI